MDKDVEKFYVMDKGELFWADKSKVSDLPPVGRDQKVVDKFIEEYGDLLTRVEPVSEEYSMVRRYFRI